MTCIKHLAFALALIGFSALAVGAQTPRLTTVNIAAESDKVQITAQGDVSEMRVDVADEQGEVVFQSGQITGQQLDWNMKDSQGERVAAGTYLVTVTFRNAAGKLRKRVEQVTVDEAERSSTPQPATAPQAAQATVTTSNAGASGKIARFTGASTIANSIITQTTTGKIGIGTDTPGSKLTVVGGGSAVINGVNNVASSNAGSGVSGTGAPGADGSGDFGPTGGAGIVGQGGKGGTGSYFGSAGGAGVVGTGGSPGDGTFETGGPGPGVLGKGGPPTGTGVEGISGSDGGLGVGGYSYSGVGVRGDSISGTGVSGDSISGDGVRGYSNTGYAGNFLGKAKFTGNLEIGGNELYGTTTRQMLNLYNTSYGIGIQASTFYFRVANTGNYNWYMGGTHSDAANDAGGGTRLMRLDSGGNLFTKGAINPTSDRHMKANFSSVDPRSVLTRLATIPIRTWNYKSEETDVRHIGPTAQDFRAAFNLGVDDKHISTVDADGVTMAAIQGLYQMMQEKDKEIQQLRAQVTQQQAQLNQVKRTIKRKRTSRR